MNEASLLLTLELYSADEDDKLNYHQQECLIFILIPFHPTSNLCQMSVNVSGYYVE